MGMMLKRDVERKLRSGRNETTRVAYGAAAANGDRQEPALWVEQNK